MPKFLQRPDGNLAYDVVGDGPPLFLLTGLGGSRGYWANLVPMLAREFTLVLHDHMCTGQSEGQRSEHTVVALANDVLALMDHLGIEKAHFLGHSTGAAIGQIIAEDDPGRVLKLVLYAGWAGPDPYFALCFEARKALVQGSGIVAYQRAAPFFLYPPSWISEDARRLDALLAGLIATSPPADVLAARIDMLLSFDRRSRMLDIGAPTLVLCAEDDQLTPMHLSEELAAGIRHAKLSRLSWGGHAASQTCPTNFLKALLEFLQH
jgi:aminoacrylate hydrolase